MGYSNIKLYRENIEKEKFIIIYYRHDGAPLRLRTGSTVKLKDWDKKTSKVKFTDTQFELKNENINNFQTKVEDIIQEFISENSIKPTSIFIKEQILSGKKIKKATVEASLLDCFSDFSSDKKIQLSSPDKSLLSFKDYKSTYHALEDYSKIKGFLSPYNLNDRVWLDQFNTFLSNPRPLIADYKFKTSKQGDKTRAKRFSILKHFGQWLIEKKYLNHIASLLNYKIKVSSKNFYALSLSELKLIQEYKFEISPEQKAVDMLIVACHTGVRYSDVIRITQTKIHNKNGTKILIMNNHKTKERIEVPLSEKVKYILEKYEYKLNLMTSQKVNYYIHEGLKRIDTFNSEYEYGIEGDTKPKSELITFHTGRRTFITNLVNNNVNLNAIMKMTGHRKISTLQMYINSDYELMVENIKVFNEL